MNDVNFSIHYSPRNFRDRIAYYAVKFMRFFADSFFKKRYGHRAVVLEIIAAIPGMVGGMLKHFECLRRMKDDHGWIHRLLDEAENEWIHLMVFIHIAQPNIFERLIIIIAQALFFAFYFILYLCSPYTAHRFVGYLEEEAIVSYTQYLTEVEEGRIPNVDVPGLAHSYWGLDKKARLADLIRSIRADEAKHRDINHFFAKTLKRNKKRA